jgi:hypothetical protein
MDFFYQVFVKQTRCYSLSHDHHLSPPHTQKNHCALKDSHTKTHTRAPTHTNLRAHTNTHTKTSKHANTCIYDMSDLTARIANTYVTCVRQRESECAHLRDVRRRSQTLCECVCVCVCVHVCLGVPALAVRGTAGMATISATT